MNAETHFNDGFINVGFIEFEDCAIASIVSCSGRVMNLDCTDNFYTVRTLMDAYIKIAVAEFDDDECKDASIRKFRDWLISLGCAPELID